MTPPFLIIDGYNLMHAAGIAQRAYGPGELERCRRRLNELVSSMLTSAAARRTTIVYDAFNSPSNDSRHARYDNLRILFARRGEDADGLIENLLQNHSAPRQVVVVSSDHRLHRAAKRRQAHCIDSEIFLHELMSEEAAARSDSKQQKPILNSPILPGARKLRELQKWAQEQQQQAEQRPADKTQPRQQPRKQSLPQRQAATPSQQKRTKPPRRQQQIRNGAVDSPEFPESYLRQIEAELRRLNSSEGAHERS